MYHIIIGGIETNLLRTLEILSSLPEYKLKVISKYPVKDKYFLDFFASHRIELTIFPEISHLGNNFFAKHWQKAEHFLLFPYFQHKYSQLFRDADVIIDYFNGSFHQELKHINKPKICWYHSSFKVYAKNIAKHNQRFLKNYDRLVVITQGFQNSLTAAAPQFAKKIKQIYNIIDTNSIQRQADTAKEHLTGRYFTCLGRLEHDKDPLTVIKAFALFSFKHPEARIYFIGDGSRRNELQQTVEKMKLTDNILFTGNLENPFGYLKNALANILSSPSEGFGNVLIEAAALHTLNIAGNCPDGPAEILLNGQNGLLFPVGDYNKLAEQLTEVWEEKINTKELTERCYDSLLRFSHKTIIKQIDALIKETSKI